DGNLGVHLRVLEKLKFVVSSKCFVDRKPRTTYTITVVGEADLNALKQWFSDTFLEGD
ncbi:MAG: transcriptional regulator, partial [Desulfobacterales bacterium]|nr:transcriptional regulator [Desulfobacterales bacterium]